MRFNRLEFAVIRESEYFSEPLTIIQMKYLLTICVLMASCSAKEPAIENKSSDQLSLHSKIQYYNDKIISAPNSMVKDELRKSYLDSIKAYIKDSLRYQLNNFSVKASTINITPVGNVKAFHASFSDDKYNEYWFEYDFPLNDDSSLQKNSAYLLLNGISEDSDTVLSFHSLGDIEWNEPFTEAIRIRIIPFPKNFNFDSSKINNTAKTN